MRAGCELKWDRMKIITWVVKKIKRGEKENARETNFSTNRKKLNSFAPVSINLKLNSSRYENRKRYAILPSYTKRNRVSVGVYWFFTSGIEREKIYNGWATDWWNQYSIHLIYVQKYWITNLQHVCVCGNCLREYFFTVLQVTYLSKSSIEKRNGNNDDDDVVDCGRPIPLNWFTYASCLSYIQAMDLLFKLKHTHTHGRWVHAHALYSLNIICVRFTICHTTIQGIIYPEIRFEKFTVENLCLSQIHI